MGKLKGGRSPKQKGNRVERMVVNMAKDKGLKAKRAYASDGRSLGLHEEVDVVINDIKVQVKARKSIAEFMKPNENVDVVVLKEDRMEPIVVLTLHEYLDNLVWLAKLN